jgi:NADH-quinone oxidoreductase subunit A
MSDPAPVLAQTAPAVHDYGAVAVLAITAVLLVLVTMVLVRLITRVANRIEAGAGKTSTYECGETPVGSAWIRFNNRFYLIAILFLGCDTLLALLLPVLPRFTSAVAAGSAAPLGFLLGVLGLVGLLVLNAARAGDLEWNKSVASGQEASHG